MVYDFMAHVEWIWVCEVHERDRSSKEQQQYRKICFIIYIFFSRVLWEWMEFIGVNASGEFSWIVSCAWALWRSRSRGCLATLSHCTSRQFVHTHICEFASYSLYSTQSWPALHTDTTRLCAAFIKSNAKPVFLRRFFVFLQWIILFWIRNVTILVCSLLILL